MSNSFRKIDYRLRPAKSIERRMMAEAFLRLRSFASVDTYRYVGLGSVYFADFNVFHSVCGFSDMISVEDASDRTIQKRFELNSPFRSITIHFAHTNQVLPKIDWSVRSIVWLDYDGPLDSTVLTDVSYLASKVSSGSLCAVSVNLDLSDQESETRSHLNVLTDRLQSADKLPNWVTASGGFKPTETAHVYRDVLAQEVSDALKDRNSGRPTNQRYVAEQVFFFEYRDSMPMLTLGWVFFDNGQRSLFDHCGFSQLAFFRNDVNSFKIEVPRITAVEAREINRSDRATDEQGESLPIPPGEIRKYLDTRRYWSATALLEWT